MCRVSPCLPLALSQDWQIIPRPLQLAPAAMMVCTPCSASTFVSYSNVLPHPPPPSPAFALCRLFQFASCRPRAASDTRCRLSGLVWASFLFCYRTRESRCVLCRLALPCLLLHPPKPLTLLVVSSTYLVMDIQYRVQRGLLENQFRTRTSTDLSGILETRPPTPACCPSRSATALSLTATEGYTSCVSGARSFFRLASHTCKRQAISCQSGGGPRRPNALTLLRWLTKDGWNIYYLL